MNNAIEHHIIANFQFNDGGRRAAGFSGIAGDCVARAIAIAGQRDYLTVWNEVALINASTRKSKRRVRCKNIGKHTADKGVVTRSVPFKRYMQQQGWEWVPTMEIGSGCKVHLRPQDLPKGRIIARVSKHYVAVIDGVINDTHDCTRDGTRCVYGYWRKADKEVAL